MYCACGSLFSLRVMLDFHKEEEEQMPIGCLMVMANPSDLGHGKNSWSTYPFLVFVSMGNITINHLWDLDSARTCYRKVLFVDPSYVPGLHNLGIVMLEHLDIVKTSWRTHCPTQNLVQVLESFGAHCESCRRILQFFSLSFLGEFHGSGLSRDLILHSRWQPRTLGRGPKAATLIQQKKC